MASKPRRRSQSKPRRRGPLSLAAGDGLATLVFVLISSTFGELSARLEPQLGFPAPLITLGLIVVLLVVVGVLCDLLGGALCNPANNAFCWAIGKGSAGQHTARIIGQVAGGVAGVWMAQNLLPPEWQTGLSGMALGMRPGVTLLEGAACEFVLGFLLTVAVLASGDFSIGLFRLAVPLAATVAAIMAGAPVTGPSLNPVVTFAWNAAFPLQTTVEHVVVFWVAPLAAGIFGGWAYLGMKQSLGAPAAAHLKAT